MQGPAMHCADCTCVKCGPALAGLPAYQLSELQAVMNATACLILNVEHITPLLRQLHWLRVPERVTFKLVTDMFRYSATDQQHTTLHTTSSVADSSLLRALVISKLDYCCRVLAGLPATLLRHLQSVLNAAARLVFSASKYSHASPLLLELHWLKVTERIKFRLCVLVYRCLNGSAPSYLAETICPVSSRSTRHHLRSASSSTVY